MIASLPLTVLTGPFEMMSAAGAVCPVPGKSPETDIRANVNVTGRTKAREGFLGCSSIFLVEIGEGIRTGRENARDDDGIKM